jgi:hypothetical protein
MNRTVESAGPCGKNRLSYQVRKNGDSLVDRLRGSNNLVLDLSGPAPTATPTPLPTATDTPLPTATDTPLPTSTPTPTATDTPLPTATPTATPLGFGWWDCDYDYRKQLTITAGTAAVPSDYTLSITFDHAALVGAGKSQADGDDIRLLYWNGSAWVELDRYLDPSSSWNDASTSLWFKTQAGIPASGSDSDYYLYYGNPAAGSAPANPGNVVLFMDDFESGDLSGWDGSFAETGDSITASSAQTYSGTYSGRAEVDTVTDAQAMVWKNLPGYTSLRAAFRIYLSPAFATTDHVTVMQFLNGWTNLLSLTINDDRTLYLWNDVAGEAYGYLTTPVISTGTWHLLEFQATISPTAGEARLWLDGNLEVEQTGVNLGSSPIDRYAAGIYWTNPRTEANLLYIDEAALVQWVDPAPSTGLGGEEASGCAATATPTTPPPTPTPTATSSGGPVADWRFDEGSGQTVADSSGYGNHGVRGDTAATESSDPMWVCSAGASALDLDGVDDHVLATDYDVLNTITIAAWIKWDVNGASDGIISKRTDNEVAGNWALRFDNTSPAYLEWMVWSGLDSSQSVLTTTDFTAIGPGVWTHVVVTFNDTTNVASFYVNGAPDNSGSITNNLANTTDPIVIGWSGQGAQYFDGRVDDVRIYDRILTPAEISTLAASPPDC